MIKFYVATLARYVLVDAESEAEARTKGLPALHAAYADVRERMGRDVPIQIQTVQPATQEEIALWTWHHEKLKAEERQ